MPSTTQGFSMARLLTYLSGPGAKVQATLNGHCKAVWPHLQSNRFSKAREHYRATGHGARTNGANYYPVQPGAVYYAQLTGATQALKPGASKAQVQQGKARAGKVWAKRRAAAAAAARKAKRRASAPAPAPAAPAPTPTPSAS